MESASAAERAIPGKRRRRWIRVNPSSTGRAGRGTRVAEFLKARDFLLEHRMNYEAAYRGFRWPRPAEFNWALDYFDAMAEGNGAIALWIVENNGRETRVTFAEMAARSNRAANFLRRAGVRRGDRILVMLGNEAALWETLLG